MAVSISQTANPAGAGSGTTITYSTQSIGVADPNRIVVVCVGAELTSGSPSSATIDYGSGAVSMTAGTLGSQGTVFSRIFYAYAPTGTTADIAITFGASQGATTHHIAVYRVLGGKFSAESAVGDTDADPISSGAITIPTGGGCIGICAMAADASARTWSGITEDIDEDAGTFQFTTGTSTTAGTPTITVSGANQEDGALAWLIFAPGYQISTDAGSYSVTGQDVTLSHGYTVAVDAGSYAVSGQDVTLSKGQTLAIDAGSYALTGADVTLAHAWAVPVDAGSYAISGAAVDLLHGRVVAVDAGSYAVTGQDVSLDYAAASNRAIVSWAEISFAVGAASIVVNSGSYSISGQDVALAHQWMMDVETGGYLVSGQDVELNYAALVGREEYPWRVAFRRRL